MSVEIKLIGFGDDRPANFDESNRCRIEIDTMITPMELMGLAKISNPTGLIFMHKDTVIAEDRWREPLISNGDNVFVMSAMEGG